MSSKAAMARAAITATGLGKRYQIGARSRYRTLRETLAGALSGGAGRRGEGEKSTLWALRGVDFRIEPGEKVGIIGRNGAGKSTLLKVLARITDPTAGEARVRGRIGSLLEVGTGFHPELTGRENVFLNGTLLGMRSAEVRRKFDEIVAFAEVERFLDTPVKRYSSGMYVRLAFAVAAHLETEILLVDEVLAVGDASFQKKCLGKMEQAARHGRTLLFVSHNLAAVENLCGRGLLIDQGQVLEDAAVGQVVQAYLALVASSASSGVLRSSAGELSVRVLDEAGRPTDVLRAGERATFVVDFGAAAPIARAGIGIGIVTPAGDRVLTFHSHYQCRGPWPVRERCTCRIEWGECFLCPGPYRLVAAVYNGPELVASWDDAGSLTVIPSDFFGTGRHPDPSHQGRVMARARWEVSADGSDVPCSP